MKNSIIFSLLMLLPVAASAYDFEVNGIYYNILSANEKTVEVTKNDGNTSDYTGVVTIPRVVTYENISFNVTAIGEKAFYNSTVSMVNLPEGITVIKRSAFQGCSNLTKCDLPKGLLSMEYAAFSGVAVDSVYIPGTVTSFEIYCYSGSMTYLEFGEGITDIPTQTFRGQYLKTIVLPASLLRIGAAAFAHNRAVRTIISKSTTSPRMYGDWWESGGYGSGTIYNPFEYSDQFKRYIYTLMVPQGAKESYANYKTSDGKPGWPVATIEEYDESTDFSKISTEFVQENMMYAITNNGHHNTVQLIKTTEESVPEIIIRDNILRNSIEFSVTSVNPNYISTNNQLRTVHAYSSQPIAVFENTFSASTKLFGTLYVPEQTKSLYENATEWKDFTNIVESDEVIPPTPNPKCANPTISYSNGQLKFECETEDVKFVSSVICIDNKNYNSSIVPLTGIYRISVYATKDGYDDSDIVTMEISIRGLKGDVNEDGEINIADVNTVIDKILTGNN